MHLLSRFTYAANLILWPTKCCTNYCNKMSMSHIGNESCSLFSAISQKTVALILITFWTVTAAKQATVSLPEASPSLIVVYLRFLINTPAPLVTAAFYLNFRFSLTITFVLNRQEKYLAHHLNCLCFVSTRSQHIRINLRNKHRQVELCL